MKTQMRYPYLFDLTEAQDGVVSAVLATLTRIEGEPGYDPSRHAGSYDCYVYEAARAIYEALQLKAGAA